MVASDTLILITECMAKVPLPGLTNLNEPLSTSSSNSEGFIHVNNMSNAPKGKNPFDRTGKWVGESLDALKVHVGPIEETTSATRRTQAQSDNSKPPPTGTRHWRSNVSFECNGWKSKVIKNFRAGVPRVKTKEYGNNYCYASLQKSIADKIISAYAAENIRVTHVENNVHGSDEEWWATINNMANRTGFIKQKQFVEKPLSTVLAQTNGGAVANIDIVVHMKLKKDENLNRNDNDVFTLSVECSRFVITGINEDIPAPDIRSQVPTISLAKDDIVDDELANALDEMI